MEQVGAGSHEACRILVERHLQRIVSFATRTLGNPAEADDIAQEVFTRLWQHAARWQPDRAQLKTWLYRVALNCCLDRLSQRQHNTLDDVPEPADPHPTSEVHLHTQDIARHINEALMHLTPSQRIAVTLCHYQGVLNSEAAAVMDISLPALESLLARGRRTLRKRLQHIAPTLLGDA